MKEIKRLINIYNFLFLVELFIIYGVYVQITYVILITQITQMVI
jgi:hypothetical protein